MGAMQGPLKGCPNSHYVASIAWVGRDRLRPTHLRATLTRLLQRESEEWEPLTFSYVTGQGEEVDVLSREHEVQWQGEACGRLGWSYETRFTAASLLDLILHRVRIPPRYLRAVAAAAVFLAAKLHEEDENVPSTMEVVNLGQMDCSHRELLRMEKVLLDKMSWYPRSSYVLDFLQVLHALAIVTGPKHQHGSRSGSPTRQLNQITERLWLVICSASSGKLKPSLISLAVLSLDLDTSTPEPGLLLWLQALTQASDEELANARELVQNLLGEEAFGTVKPDLAVPQGYRASPSRPNKRKVGQSMDSDDDLYLDIKKLYACEKVAMSSKVGGESPEEIDDTYYDIRRLYASPVPISVDTSQLTTGQSPGMRTVPGSTKKRKKKTKPTFKAKTAVRSCLKQAFKIPCKISLISTKKIFEEMQEEEDEEEEEDMMEFDGEEWDGPLVEPVGILKSPIFSPMSPEFPDIRHLVVKKEDMCWQQHAQEVTEQIYRPMTYAQVLRLHLSPLTQALSV